MKKLFSTTLALLLVASLTAQITLGPRAGLNLTNMNMGLVDNTDFKAGFQIGGILDIPVFEGFYAIRPTDLFSIQTGLLFTQKGGQFTSNLLGTSMSSSTRINYLMVPVSQLFFLEIARETRLIFQTGVNLGFALGGTIRTEIQGETETQSIEFGSAEHEFNSFDFGVNFGIGVEFLNFQVGVGYSIGISNLSNVRSMVTRNNGFAFTVTYLFDLF